jgi:hypothetical protein
MQRCVQCNRPFGLIRYRLAAKRFCSKACMHEYRTDLRLFRLRAWVDLFAGKKTGRSNA